MPLTLPDFNLSPEQVEFRDTLRRFFEANAPMTETRRVMASGEGISSALWEKAGAELGLVGLAIPEAHGGQGFGLKELAIALGEVGRALAPIPLQASAALAGRVVARVLEASGAKADRWLEPLAAGQIATLAWLEDGGSWELGRVRLEAKPSGSAFRLSGEKRLVLDGAVAERFFVVARSGGGLGLFAVDAGAPGLTVSRQEAFDPTRPLARMRFENVEVEAVGAPGEDRAAIERGLEDASVLACAEMIGGMQRVLEAAVDYANARHQFGRPIGSFQAIKHKCADMLIDFEGARTAVEAAIEACDAGDGDDAAERALLAAVAKAKTGPAYVRMAIENMQIQGGVGYTWEYDAHLYYRRAQSGEVFHGRASDHHDRIARLLASSAAARTAAGRAVAAGGGAR
ncbi:MAG: acyl-CoA dehydrogenase family protein [Myxococcota bacterium]